MEEKEEKELKLLIAAASRSGNLMSFTANRQNNLFGEEWLLEIRTSSNAYKLVLKRGHERRFKTVNAIAKKAKEMGASELVVKF
jgi:hydroxylamine reductase (hybrid-cluster protein)